ncbi:MAG: potassium transporter TrkG, partial [Clostridia bacterium]|nr:potassium transporter TrkG [Clostridia bacterium]
ALLYAFVFVPQYGWGTGLWYSIFHAVSAFCNAGIDILGPDSLLPYANNSWILFVTMLLIVLGGLGFIVWLDLSRHMRERIQNRKTPSRLSEHTKLVLWLTAGLIFSGAAMILLFEWSNPQTIGPMPIRKKVLHSLFQSVTFRTAGFAAIPQAGLTDSSVLLGCIYMFIGGSPMGTAGGVKTVTFFLLVASAHSYIRNRGETVLLRRRVSEALIRKSAAIIGFSLIVTLIMSAALLAADGIPMADGMFEVFSATATVGLSRGITSTLSPLGRILIIICMYLGRIGPISIALFFESSEGSENGIKHANGRYFVG